MVWDKHVGRVGALAVALGIGSAVAAMPGVAWAQPDGTSAASQSDSSPERAEASGSDDTIESPTNVSGTDDTAESDDDTDSDDDTTDEVAEADDETTDEVADSDDDTGSDDPEPGDDTLSDRHSSTRGPGEGRNLTDANRPATQSSDTSDAAGPDAAGEVPSSQDDRVDPPPAPLTQRGPAAAVPTGTQQVTVSPGGTPAPSVTEEPTAPTPTLATVLRSLFSPSARVNQGSTPDAPGASPLLWTLLAYARREFDRTPSTIGGATPGAAQVGEAQANATSPAIPGSSYRSPVIAADGTIYQVTSDTLGRTRVTILDSSGQILATSREIPGSAPNLGAVARPDGTLVVVTKEVVFFVFDRTIVSSVDNQGTVTRIATLTGSPDRQVKVGANGALYLSTSVAIPAPIAERSVPYRFFRISPGNTVRSFAPDTAFELAPDGTAYLVSSQSGFSTLRVINPAGGTRAIPLPYGSDPSAPILGQDGTVYVAAGVRGLFGAKTTRLYTVDGASTTVRTIAGLPGRTVAGADGLYLESFTYPGSTDDGTTGTTYIFRITGTAVTTSTPIAGRIAYLQATADGTVYAPIRDASLTTTPVNVVNPDGTVATVTLPGRLVERAPRVSGGGNQSANDVGYVNYTADGTEYVAVLNPDATVSRVITLPPGGSGGQAFFGPDGAAYELVSYRDSSGQEVSRQILALSTGTLTANVPGTSYSPQVDDVYFGPDGLGYLVTRTPPDPTTPPDQVQDRFGVDVLGFNGDGETVVRSSGLSSPVIETGADGRLVPLVFGPDGTAYLTIYNFLNPGQSGVYALPASGVQKVADLEYRFAEQAHLPTFAADGTGYVTAGDFYGTVDEQSTVTVFSTAIAPATATRA